VFTGIVEELGRVRHAVRRDGIVSLAVDCDRVRHELRPGDSVAVNGCCQTVVEVDDAGFTVETVPQTLAVTTLGELGPDSPVNLEGSLRMGAPVGGHLVLGHVDGVGEVISAASAGADRRIRVRVPRALMRYLAPRGSVAVDGVSLTVASVADDGFEVALIPTTLERTLAGGYRAGSRVNIEVDVVARYLERLATRALDDHSKGEAT
jgi:riboflavin synthase alpha subunit